MPADLPPDPKSKAPASDAELLELSGGLFLEPDAPLFCSPLDILELEKIAELWANSVESATSARQIVLETWLLVDYWVRLLLAGAFNIAQYSTDDFDLRYELLPQSFDRCLSLLERLYATHLKLPEQKPSSAVSMSIGFAYHLRRNERDLFDKIIEADNAYIKAEFGVEPYDDGHIRPLPSLDKRNPTRLSNGWMKTIAKLDASWYKTARRLNKARNVAAHSTDNERILLALGVKGDNAIAKVRKDCEFVVKTLLGLVKGQPTPASGRA